jgi:2-methylcitrate dehydratase PrpD
MPDKDADLVEHFAAPAVDTRFADRPTAAVEAAKQSIFDTLGVSLAASGLEPSSTPYGIPFLPETESDARAGRAL